METESIATPLLRVLGRLRRKPKYEEAWASVLYLSLDMGSQRTKDTTEFPIF